MPLLRTRTIALVAGVFLAQSRSARGQAITLPTIRASKTPEMTLLDQMIRVLQTSTRQPVFATTKGTDAFNCDVARLALAPYTKHELAMADAAANTTADSAGSKTPRKVNQLRAARLSIGLLKKRPDKDLPDGLVDIFTKAPDDCELRTEITQLDIHRIVSPYIGAETDVELKAHLDSLELVARANAIRRDLRERHWFPVGSHDEATAFWRQPSASSLNIGAISGSGDQGATFTELTSRFLHAFRLSFNTVIASTKDSTAKPAPTGTSPAKADTGASPSAISRFLNGGGLLNLAVAYPLVHYGQANGAADLLAVLAPRFGATVPVLGASQRDTTLMYDVGSEFMFKSADFIDGVGVFVQTRVGIAGGSPRFMSLIGDNNQHRTGYQTVTGGISLDDRFLITLSRTVAGPRALQNTGWQVGVSLARSAASPGTSR